MMEHPLIAITSKDTGSKRKGIFMTKTFFKLIYIKQNRKHLNLASFSGQYMAGW
jgi:hypothetical protein